MASLPRSIRRKPARMMALFLLVVAAFILASLVQKRFCNDFIDDAQCHEFALQSNVDRRLQVEGNSNYHHPLHMAQFIAHSHTINGGNGLLYPSTHPSRPYFITKGDKGEYINSIEDGHPDHPLSRLVDLRVRRETKEPVFFFVIPKVNGGVMKAIMTKCYNLTRTENFMDAEPLTFRDGVLNLDTQTLKGLADARSIKIMDSDIVDVIATSYFLEGSMLFSTLLNKQARSFTILQHPVIRAESLYLARDPTLQHATFREFIESHHYIDNWVVRSLTNDKKGGQLTEEHLFVAKAILARKFMVGIAEFLEETIKRLEMYYGWHQLEGCVPRYLMLHEQHAKMETDKTFHIERGDDYWTFVTMYDKFDLMLYYYALELFAKQGSTMFKRPYVDKTGKLVDFEERKKKLQDQLQNSLLTSNP